MMKKYKLLIVIAMLATIMLHISTANAAMSSFALKMSCETFLQKYNSVNSDNPYIPQIVSIYETAQIQQAIFITDRPQMFIAIMGWPYHSGEIETLSIGSEKYDEDLNYLTNTFLGGLNAMDFPYDADAWGQLNIFFDEIVNQRKRISNIALINKKTNERWNCNFERKYDQFTNKFQCHFLGIHKDLSYTIFNKK